MHLKQTETHQGSQWLSAQREQSTSPLMVIRFRLQAYTPQSQQHNHGTQRDGEREEQWATDVVMWM